MRRPFQAAANIRMRLSLYNDKRYRRACYVRYRQMRARAGQRCQPRCRATVQFQSGLA